MRHIGSMKMRHVLTMAIVACAFHVHAEKPKADAPAPVIRRQFLPLTPSPGKPGDINTDPLWLAVAKTDPPGEWHKVITPNNRENFPAEFKLNVFTDGATATFWFTYSQTNFETMLHQVELFEPDPSVLDSPRADKGLVSVRVQTHSDKKKDAVVYRAEFTYPTNRLSNGNDRLTRCWYSPGKWEKEVMTYLSDRITVDPEQCGGRPCVRGMTIWIDA